MLSTHSMHSPLQEAGTPQGDAESAGQRRRVSLPGPCAVAERVRGCCHTITSGIQLLLVPVRVPSSECPYLCPRVSVDALFAFLDCALGFFPCYFLFGCKRTNVWMFCMQYMNCALGISPVTAYSGV